MPSSRARSALDAAICGGRPDDIIVAGQYLVDAAVRRYLRHHRHHEWMEDDLTGAGLAALCEAVAGLPNDDPVEHLRTMVRRGVDRAAYYERTRAKHAPHDTIADADTTPDRHSDAAHARAARMETAAEGLETCEILKLKREGKSNAEIAKILGVRKETIAAHLYNAESQIVNYGPGPSGMWSGLGRRLWAEALAPFRGRRGERRRKSLKVLGCRDVGVPFIAPIHKVYVYIHTLSLWGEAEPDPNPYTPTRKGGAE